MVLLIMMRNKKNTIAKLLAEEDIFVVYKQMESAYFDVKNRELGLPIWKKDAMEDVEEELLICHEIGHALETPLDMLENAALRNIEHSVVNVLEDARIEKKVKNRYLGTVRIFNDGYASLIKKDFFGTKTKKIEALNMIDRINLHFKNHVDVPFAENETVWVDRAAKTETPDEVLDLAEELIAWMKDNPESMGNPDESGETGETGDTDDMGDPMNGSGTSGESKSGESGEGESGEKTDGENNNDDKSDDDNNDDADADGDDGKGTDNSETGDGKELKAPETDDVIEGGKDGSDAAASPNITAETADKFGKALDAARDKTAESYAYVRINNIDLNKIVVPYKNIISEMDEHYVPKSHELFYASTKEEIEELKKTSKKTVAYMVKEFEMKKSADQYARAATSKTGSLDMGKLHTYKYNEDLFKKVTTLPGATNHGLVMCLDWSGSMADNLKGTLSQLYNLIWFCRRTNIPFEVHAFSDYYARHKDIETEKEMGTFELRKFVMLNFFSSKMTIDEEMKVMHYLWMIANQWGYRDWRDIGYPIKAAPGYNLGGTPLNEAIIAMMKIVPNFKKETGVQKVHSIFLTDGAGSRLDNKWEYKLDTYEHSPTFGEHVESLSSLRGKLVITDPVTNKTITSLSISNFGYWDSTPVLLGLLKKRIPEMNVVGFFVAGSGRKGKIAGNTLRYILNSDGHASDIKINDALKTIKKDNVLTITSNGYDNYYVLPGAEQLNVEGFELSDDLVGASKAKLKSAFAKSASGRISSRPLLNKFVSMVA